MLAMHPVTAELLDVRTVAGILGVEHKTVRRLITGRKIRYMRVGTKLIRFRREWVDAYLSGKRVDDVGD